MLSLAAGVSIQRGTLVELIFDQERMGELSGLECDEGVHVVGESLVLVEDDSSCRVKLTDYGQVISFPIRVDEVQSGYLRVSEEPESRSLWFVVVSALLAMWLLGQTLRNKSRSQSSFITVGFVDNQTPLKKINAGEPFHDDELIDLALHPDVAYVLHLDDSA